MRAKLMTVAQRFSAAKRGSPEGLPHLKIFTKATKATKATKYEAFLFFVIFVIFVVVDPLRGLAQPQEPLRLSLAEAQARAQEASRRLAELRAREAGAHAAIASSEAASRPLVSVMAGYTRTNHVEEFVVPGPGGGPPRVLYPDIPDNYRARLDLQWPIYTGGRTDALERAARAEAAAAASDVAAARADLRLEVARAFWALVTARSSVSVLEQALTRAQAHVRDVSARLDAGLIPPNELASAGAQESRQRMLLIEAANQRDVAAAELARLVGESVVRPVEPVETLDGGTLGASSEALLAEALAARAEREALEQRIEAARERRAAAAAGARPVVSVGGGFDYARPNPRIFPRAGRWDDSWDASVNVSWSVWDGGRTNAEIASATAATDALRRRLEEFDSVLALEIRQRLLDLQSTRAAIAAASDAARAAEEARRVVAERYAAGVVANADVLDAQLALLQADLDRTRALANARLAEARLERSAGR